MISVIVPTMWNYEPFARFVMELVKVPAIGEVIIIDNDPQKNLLQGFTHPKLSVHAQNKNLVVNPSWNLGARLAQNEKLCFLNDDVIVDTKVFYKIDEWLNEHVGAVGVRPPDPANNDLPFVDGSIDIVPHKAQTLYSFGTLFFVHKKNWIPIPESLQLGFGDNWVYDSQIMLNKKVNYLISNIFYYHAIQQTASKFPDTCPIEGPIYQKLFEEMKQISGPPSSSPPHQSKVDILEMEYQDACSPDPTCGKLHGMGFVSDMYQHAPRLRALASTVKHVTELGVREGLSTRAFLVNDLVLRSYDIVLEESVKKLFDIARSLGKDVIYQYGDSRLVDLEPTDLLFIDTNHEYELLSAELARHHVKVKKYIVCHDTHQPCGMETLPAILEFLAEHPEWRVKTHYTDCHGMTVLERLI